MRLTRKAILIILLLGPVVVRAGDISKELIEAARKGDAVTVEALLEVGADVNATAKNGVAALIVAEGLGHTDIVQLLEKAESPEGGSVKTAAVSSALSEIDPAKETDIRHLMEVTGAKKQLNQMKPFMAKQMKPLAEQLIMPRLPPDLRDPQIPERFVQRFIERFDPDELINRIVPVYDKYYTREDVKQIIQFFETPLGRKFLETSPQLMQESMTVGQQYGAEVGRKVGAEIADKVLSKRKK